MKAELQRPRRETAILPERAQREIHESRKPLEQRENQLKLLGQVLEQHPTLAVKLLELGLET
jgi:hypothetical protein